MLTSLLATKFYTLRPTSDLVARPRLTQRLDDGLRQTEAWLREIKMIS